MGDRPPAINPGLLYISAPPPTFCRPSVAKSVRNNPNTKTKKSAKIYENESEVVCKLKCFDILL